MNNSTFTFRLRYSSSKVLLGLCPPKKILEQFHYFNIHADVDSVYGNWAVSTDGDVVNFLYPYAILAIHFKDTDWMEKMRTKVWFRPECEDALLQALCRAKDIHQRA